MRKTKVLCKIYDMQCNDMVEPIGIDSPIIMFSWKLESDISNIYQKSWRIKVWDEDEIM
ncbi:MAG: hypothetical protein GX675_02810 [Erysipelotrichaceae bacterium]|nr:hypothetical protein [Erysipelotrichaceae bacterium]